MSLSSARRCILAAMDDPEQAAALLAEAAEHLDAVLAWTLRPGAPRLEAKRMAKEAEELWTIMACFEEVA